MDQQQIEHTNALIQALVSQRDVANNNIAKLTADNSMLQSQVSSLSAENEGAKKELEEAHAKIAELTQKSEPVEGATKD